MNRKLAVPVAIRNLKNRTENTVFRTRALKGVEEDPEDAKVARKLAENRIRLDKLLRGIEGDLEMIETEDLSNELDYIEASIQLGLLEITGELEEAPCSDELFEETALA